MIVKIIGKIMTYLGFLWSIAEINLRMCHVCHPNVCPAVVGTGVLFIVIGCLLHEVYEK